MKKVLLSAFLSLSLITFLSSCNNDNEYDISTKTDLASDSILGKRESFVRFTEILSKAAYERKDIRDFLRSEALEEIDNGYNIFYPLSKQKKITSNETLEDILKKYSSSEDEMQMIENNLPLLNIHIPELFSNKVTNMDLEDEDMPFLLSNKLYVNGIAVDSLEENEIPDFNLFVIDESNSIRKKDGISTRSSEALSINSEYEYVAPYFAYKNDKQKNNIRTSGYEENLDSKYLQSGYINSKEIDPILLKAFQASKNNKRATRTLVYYGLDNINSPATNLRTDIKDCIFRFKVSATAFTRYEAIATNNGKNPLINGSTSQKKHGLSREEVLSRLLTGRSFCFMFRIESNYSDKTVTTEGMKIYASPKDLFNLSINESKRHKTGLRHSKYTYSIDKSNIKEKWYYPLEHGHDSRLNRWNIVDQPIEKRIVVYLVDPNDGITENVEEEYTVSYITKNELGASITGEIAKVVNVGINGKINSETTTTKKINTKYTINHTNERIDEFFFNFFNDYPIEEETSNNLTVPYRIGKGVIEMSILPISNYFYNYGRFN